ncbi:MAG: ABC transporter permease subunit [Bacillota bacterium]|nr:ABC transporter permease subunit [Bacillota bacterium]
MLSGSTFPQVFANTLIIGALKLAFGFPAPIILAILLNEVRHTAFKRTVQTISYLPHFISWVVLAGMFSQLLSPTTGAVNYILQRVTGKTINFMADPEWFRATVVATSIWKGVGWSSIIYLASLGSIDGELYEAAEIDGANRFRRVWHITLPGLLPIIMIQLILNVGSIINDDFDQIFNMYSVPVYSVGDVISTYTYREGLINRDYGFSTAVGLSKNVISFILIIVTNKITSRFTEYGVW